ncbi:MAG: addiction module killer protein [Bacteroidales bacterium]|nr:addiction module killer protein [Bacteroidales bacterium]
MSRKQYGMIVTFDRKYLRDLYETGKTDDDSYRFQSEAVRLYIRCIRMMLSVADMQELCRYNGLNVERLTDDRYVIGVNRQCRIEFTVRDEGAEPVVTVCNIMAWINHYK